MITEKDNSTRVKCVNCKCEIKLIEFGAINDKGVYCTSLDCLDSIEVEND